VKLLLVTSEVTSTTINILIVIYKQNLAATIQVTPPTNYRKGLAAMLSPFSLSIFA
jgi:hypothetical protein